MATECSGAQYVFPWVDRRRVEARLDGGRLSSEGGGVLLREVEVQRGIVRRFAACFTDQRKPALIEHPVAAGPGSGLRAGREEHAEPSRAGRPWGGSVGALPEDHRRPGRGGAVLRGGLSRRPRRAPRIHRARSGCHGRPRPRGARGPVLPRRLRPLLLLAARSLRETSRWAPSFGPRTSMRRPAVSRR